MIIVNFSTNEYVRGQQRLKNSLDISGMGYFMAIDDYRYINSPTHQESPYEFKVHSIRKALSISPIVLWVDSSMYRVGDLSKIEKIIKEEGFFAEEAGHYVGRWTNQFTKNYFKLTEEEMKQDTGGMIMFSAGLIGLNRDSETAMVWLELWEHAAKQGCFKGDWKDHRHDMTCGSIIAQRLGIKYQRGGSHLAYIGEGYGQPEPGVVFYCRGIV